MSKKIKKVKQPKLPKKTVSVMNTRAEKKQSRLIEKRAKELLRERDKQNKDINKRLGAAAVILCLISSVLDIIAAHKKNM